MSIRAETLPDRTSADDLEQHRRELTGYCYRMLGSGFDADDAVQETMVRAWGAIDGFEGRSSLRSWLFRIATNVCLDMLRGRQRRAWPVDLGPASPADRLLPNPLPESAWVEPIADSRVLPDTADPAELAEAKESIRFAFITALQHLPARQRAVLILRDVLRWQAAEVAELLGSSVASVNSALQRAHATLGSSPATESARHELGPDQTALLEQYVDAFERYDVSRLVALLHEDAIMSMPPFPMWLRGPVEIGRWFLGQGIGCRGSRLLATRANGGAAFGSYKPDPDGGYKPFALQLIEVSGDRITGHFNFLNPRLFPQFGLPEHLPA